ncbi:FAD-dependent 5-carboxymethylaminomethyl-2-thiouridine(34) oxidoreductase MnmC [Shewanella sp. UCD-KL12]|uniref:FAD-dependent 5-carboxymethylaminomethyl-2-thiouridine(34) oxidoreductase MnmC n=1 Tax=Shewanella sp. UCD-KL12 TaxID=1917163 RepID=UPI000970AB9B|nr:FAD-dependent 5-carboxymethylaminomethyl-2-thiouridine(34) oxidoreductase MnmC [Shewanella sp. UCD-KL12]
MPKVRHRVNSLTKEREEKTVNSGKTGHFDSFIAQIGKKHPTNKCLSLGIIGLDDVQQLLSLILLQQKSEAMPRLNVKVFEADYSALTKINLALKAPLNSQKNSVSHAEKHAAIKQLSDTELVTIPGCQRLILNQGDCVIDLYLGDIHSSLSNTFAPTHAAHLIDHWLHHSPAQPLNEAQLWQMAKLSSNKANLYSVLVSSAEAKIAAMAGFALAGLDSTVNADGSNDHIALQERSALRQAQSNTFQHYPLSPAQDGAIAIIGGGIASTHLALSLAERNKTVRLFCQDNSFAQQASGNKQGAVYPLLTPDNGTLSQYYQQGLLFSRRRLTALVNEGFSVAHELCGVLHTGHDERSRARIERIIASQGWPEKIAHRVSAKESSELAGIDINKEGVFYPLGGWISPPQFTQAAFDKAARLSDVRALFNCNINRIEQQDGDWYLYQSPQNDGNEIVHGPFATLVLANGHGLTQFEQSKHLPATGFRGQVSHVPARNELAKLDTVLCSHGYLTPSNNQLHCTGASYIKDPKTLAYSSTEQLENFKKMQHSYVDKSWVDDIDISGHSARVGVRMVTRDHAPMMGCAPDTDKLLESYQQHQHTKESILFWKGNPAPTYKGLFILGGLGSRGITSGPLAAEVLAAQLCGEVIPLDKDTLALLNPNRMWMRKLIKGKAL